MNLDVSIYGYNPYNSDPFSNEILLAQSVNPIDLDPTFTEGELTDYRNEQSTKLELFTDIVLSAQEDESSDSDENSVPTQKKIELWLKTFHNDFEEKYDPDFFSGRPCQDVKDPSALHVLIKTILQLPIFIENPFEYMNLLRSTRELKQLGAYGETALVFLHQNQKYLYPEVRADLAKITDLPELEQKLLHKINIHLQKQAQTYVSPDILSDYPNIGEDLDLTALNEKEKENLEKGVVKIRSFILSMLTKIELRHKVEKCLRVLRSLNHLGQLRAEGQAFIKFCETPESAKILEVKNIKKLAWIPKTAEGPHNKKMRHI